MKIGIFGGTFNPPHMGHVNSVQTVFKKLGLDKVYIVPAYESPLKIPTAGPTPEQRLELTKKAFEAWGGPFIIETCEIVRKGKSYSIDTLRHLQARHPNDDLYFIVGIDKLEELERWKNAESLLSEANWIITSRPGFSIPETMDELPSFIRSKTSEFEFGIVQLNTKKNIQFLKLKDHDISSVEVRKNIRTGRPVSNLLPLSVETYIRDNKLYSAGPQKISDYGKLAEFCGQAIFDKKGIQVMGYDLRKLDAPSEFVVVASGTSVKHTSSLGDAVLRAVKDEFGLLPYQVEGIKEGRWVIVDYGSLMIHLFYDFVRREYHLEDLWRSAPNLNLKDRAL